MCQADMQWGTRPLNPKPQTLTSKAGATCRQAVKMDDHTDIQPTPSPSTMPISNDLTEGPAQEVPNPARKLQHLGQLHGSPLLSSSQGLVGCSLRLGLLAGMGLAGVKVHARICVRVQVKIHLHLRSKAVRCQTAFLNSG